MKKIVIIGIIFLSLSSCASGGWSCKKRYCEAQQKPSYQLEKQIKKVEVKADAVALR